MPAKTVSLSEAPLETTKYCFSDDYSEGAHPLLLEALVISNTTQQTGYGNDIYTSQARSHILRLLQVPQNENAAQSTGVFFVPSGTSANIISISASLRPHESVIASTTGHIVMRETGAIEATGHKILTVEPELRTGKLTPKSIQKVVAENWHYPHMAKPRMVYISNATEMGTVYRRAELQAIKQVCEREGLLVLMDGARLGTAMASPTNDVEWKDVWELTDIFWIGGTKNGALLGEAIVVKDAALARDFEFYIKRHGALLAKGRIMGTQFEALFRDREGSDTTLFDELAEKANGSARLLAKRIGEAGFTLEAECETNQVFAALPRGVVEKLKESFEFYEWETRLDGMVVVRLLTSWATDEAQIEKFGEVLRRWRAGEVSESMI